MRTNSQSVYLSQQRQVRNMVASAGSFLWHYLQMALAMQAGMLAYHKIVGPLLEQPPYAEWTNAYPIIGFWGMILSMVLGMLTLMVYHRSSGRYCLEMSLAMVAPIAALTVLVLCSLIPLHVLHGAGDPVMYVAMAGYMLFRPHDHAHVGHEHACH